MKTISPELWDLSWSGTDELQHKNLFGEWEPSFTVRNVRDQEYARARVRERPENFRFVRYHDDEIVMATNEVKIAKEWKVLVRRGPSDAITARFLSSDDAKAFFDATLNSTNAFPEMVD